MTASLARKKLIEVALPLDEINKAAAKEKSIRHGHPSTLHLWWARRPLAACRAVLFASLVDDPSARPDLFPTETEQEAERERLFEIIRKLVVWENSTNEAVLREAREEILKATDGNPPPVLDPFCGGGSIPLEAQRLGLEAHGSDLNPVAVLITKALIEIPPKFAGRPPVNPVDRGKIGGTGAWRGAAGLAADVRYYGAWMRAEAERRIGHLYPKARLPKVPGGRPGGGEATVIAWLWARTVTCPNPACGAEMPLISSFVISTKAGKQTWVEPIVEAGRKRVRFSVRQGQSAPSGGTINQRGATCIVCGADVPLGYIRAEGLAGNLSAQCMAVVAEGQRSRIYLSPTDADEQVAGNAMPSDGPTTNLPEKALGFRVQNYGIKTHGDLFAPRQLVALTTFSELITAAREKISADVQAGSLLDKAPDRRRHDVDSVSQENAIATYLAFAVDRLAESSNTVSRWQSTGDKVAGAFTRQAISMIWDYAEVNPFSNSTRNFGDAVEWVAQVLDYLAIGNTGISGRQDVTNLTSPGSRFVCCTDPPYYDNIGYADLSDFFYVWLRRSLITIYPELFQTMLTPKAGELIAFPHRHEGKKDLARRFFESGLSQAFSRMHELQLPEFPMSVFYAFKQAEDEGETPAGTATVSTGWETMLQGLLDASFAITGTWPMHTERPSRSRNLESNALASSIVIVCRPRSENARVVTRRDFMAKLREELPDALIRLQHGNVAPVDLAQAAIGPGMAVFSRYAKVLEADGSPMTVRTALALINQELDAYLEAQEGELDVDTRFCIAWYDQYGHKQAAYGEADVLARAKNTSVAGLHEARVLKSEGGKVHLLRREEYDADWNPLADRRKPVWECAQHLIRRFETGGAEGAGALLAQLGPETGENARALAYRLYTLCERRGRAEDALAYNGLVTAWPEIQAAGTRVVGTEERQGRLGV